MSNDDTFTSYYEAYFYVDTTGEWYFSTDSDDASEIVVDDQVVAYWYNGHGYANRWEHKCDITLHKYDTHEWLTSTQGNSDGTYTFNLVLPGSYIVMVSAPDYERELWNDGEGTADWDKAKAVSVRD